MLDKNFLFVYYILLDLQINLNLYLKYLLYYFHIENLNLMFCLMYNLKLLYFEIYQKYILNYL